MNINIRPVTENDIEALCDLSVLAWAPIFQSFEQVLGSNIFHQIWPAWQTNQKETVEAACQDSPKTCVLVAELDERVVGFLAYQLNHPAKTGEVTLLAVHPEYQKNGIGAALNDFALRIMKENGIKLAIVETGGDPSHAPARRSYEKAGYTALPVVRYFKDLTP